MSVKICASILSANFLKLGNELKRVENAGCDPTFAESFMEATVDSIGECKFQRLM